MKESYKVPFYILGFLRRFGPMHGYQIKKEEDAMLEKNKKIFKKYLPVVLVKKRIGSAISSKNS